MWRHRAFLSVFISGVDVTGKSKFGRLTHAGAERGLVARLIGNGNNWPLGSICLMGGIGNQSYCLSGSIPCNSSMEASLSDALCLSCILNSDPTCYKWQQEFWYGIFSNQYFLDVSLVLQNQIVDHGFMQLIVKNRMDGELNYAFMPIIQTL